MPGSFPQAGATSSSLRGGGSDVGSGTGAPVRHHSMGSGNVTVNSSPPGIASHGSHKPSASSASGATPRPTSAHAMPALPPPSVASPARPSSAQSNQSQTAAQRSFSAQSSQSQVRPDLRRWTDEDLRRQIQLLEKGLKGASTAGAGGRNGSPPPVHSSGTQSPRASNPALQSLVRASTGVDASESSSPVPPDFLEHEVKQSPGADPVPGKLEVELSLKQRQVVELRAQIARRETKLSSRGRVVDGIELEHPDPERTGPPALASSAGASVANAAGATCSVASGSGSVASLERLVAERLVAERAASNAGANTPGTQTLPSTPGGRDTSQLEGELAWVVRQMEGHRRQISEHQQKLSALEKRHAEIITALSAHGIGASRSPASTLAERLEMLDDSTNGFDAGSTRLGFHKELLEAASGDSGSLRREFEALGPDDVLNGSVASSTLSASVARATERAERALRGYGHGRGSSRPTSAGSNTTAASLEAGSTTRSVRSQGNPFAPKVGRDALGRGLRLSTASGSATGSRQKVEGNDLTGGARGSAALAPEGAGFGKSNEAERIVYLLTQFGMKRPLRVPFVPLDAAVEGEGRPYLHGALEVRLCLSGDGDRLMVRVGSGPSGTGGRLFEIEEFVNRAEAIEARRSQRPTPIAEEVALQAESPLADRSTDGIGKPFVNVDNADNPSLMSMLGRSKQDYVDNGNSALPWKKLFKSHWSGTG